MPTDEALLPNSGRCTGMTRVDTDDPNCLGGVWLGAGEEPTFSSFA